MRIVIGLGGNALLARGETPDARIQLGHIVDASAGLAALAQQHEVVICHGNGPQVGLLAVESQDDGSLTEPYPLDALGAQTQGMIGYWLARSLRNAGLASPVVAVVTQTVVDAADPALAAPTKFVGRTYPEAEARSMAVRHGWQIAADGPVWRRVVASPEPLAIVELDSIALLLGRGTTVICGGGGGAPVAPDGDGRLLGLEAVVDKDLTAALLATSLGADRLVLLTDVAAVMEDFGLPSARPRSRITLGALATETFPAGSMAPKVEACRRFVAATGRPATIGALTDAERLVAGTAGTTVVPDAAVLSVGLPSMEVPGSGVDAPARADVDPHGEWRTTSRQR